MKKYQITLNEEQLKLLEKYIEEGFRVRMGQMGDLASDLAMIGNDYTNEKENRNEIFNRYIDARDAVNDELCCAYRLATGRQFFTKSDEVINLIDMWHVIRHQIWKDGNNHDYYDVRSSVPQQEGQYPMIKIERIEDDDK